MLLLLLPHVLVIIRRDHLVGVDWRSMLRMLRRSVLLLLLLLQLLWRVLRLGVVRGGEFFVGFLVFVVFVAFVGGEGEHVGLRGLIGLVGECGCEGEWECDEVWVEVVGKERNLNGVI